VLEFFANLVGIVVAAVLAVFGVTLEPSSESSEEAEVQRVVAEPCPQPTTAIIRIDNRKEPC
jgi:hypothetical protein